MRRSLSSKLRSQQGTAVQMGRLQRYKLEVYCSTFQTSCTGWGCLNVAQIVFSGRVVLKWPHALRSSHNFRHFSFEPKLGAYQSLAQKIKVPFSRIFSSFLKFFEVRGRFQNPRHISVRAKLRLKRFPISGMSLQHFGFEIAIRPPTQISRNPRRVHINGSRSNVILR